MIQEQGALQACQAEVKEAERDIVGTNVHRAPSDSHVQTKPSLPVRSSIRDAETTPLARKTDRSSGIIRRSCAAVRGACTVS